MMQKNIRSSLLSWKSLYLFVCAQNTFLVLERSMIINFLSSLKAANKWISNYKLIAIKMHTAMQWAPNKHNN